MIKNSFLKLAVLLFAVTLLGACGGQPTPIPFECKDAIGCVTIKPGEPIKIGVLQVLSGGPASIGIEQARTIELEIDQLDNKFMGHPVELQVEDSKCSPEGGANTALKIVADPQSVAILGTTCSGAGATASKIMSEAGLVMISSSNTASSLTAIGKKQGENWQPGYFRTIYNDAATGQMAATFAFQELGLTRAATVNSGDTYTKGLTDAFSEAFTELGGEIVSDIVVDENEVDQQQMLIAVAESGAELMFFPFGRPEISGKVIQQVRKTAGLEKIIIIGGEGMVSDVFIETAGEDGIGVYFPTPATVQSPANDELRAAYKVKYGESPPGVYYSFAHDAVNMLLNAMESAVVKDENGTLHIGRQDLRDALYTTNFEGVTGNLTCNQFGDCSAVELNIVRLDDPATGVEGLKSNVVYSYRPH
jgi:branched-chain amino acid transport system substrate-binding protein